LKPSALDRHLEILTLELGIGHTSVMLVKPTTKNLENKLK